MGLLLDILDVGQGDGIFVWFPNRSGSVPGKVMMVDFGSVKNKQIVKEDSFKYLHDHTLFGKGGQTLDWLVLTHGDSDHYNLVWNFLSSFAVNVRNVVHGGDEAEYGDLIAKLRRRRNSDRSTRRSRPASTGCGSTSSTTSAGRR